MKVFAGLLALALVAAVHPDKPCVRTTFETEMYADACKAGGQEKAKDAAKNFLKKAKVHEPATTCGTCHSKLAPRYELKTDALAIFHRLQNPPKPLPPSPKKKSAEDIAPIGPNMHTKPKPAIIKK